MTDETAALRFHLQESQHMQKTNLYKMVAANHKAAKTKTENDWLRLQVLQRKRRKKHSRAPRITETGSEKQTQIQPRGDLDP